jgi:hypothetical protein
MRVKTAAIGGTYEELVDAAENILEILSARANDQLDLTPAVERWLVDQLEQIEVTLAARDARPAIFPRIRGRSAA